MSSFISFMTLLISMSAFAKTEIIGGKIVAIDDELRNSVVGIIYYNQRTQRWGQGCTGSVVSSRKILTAAHCVENVSNEDLLINFSIAAPSSVSPKIKLTTLTDLEKYFTIRKVHKIKRHPHAKKSLYNDLAIIYLSSDIPPEAIPVRLIDSSMLDYQENKTIFDQEIHPVLLYGFGVYIEKQNLPTSHLRKVEVQAKFNKNELITFQENHQGACGGDSGGPAFIFYNGLYYQAGITQGSYGNSSTCHEKGLYIIAPLNQFIRNELKKR